jgi:hypothetical protein
MEDSLFESVSVMESKTPRACGCGGEVSNGRGVRHGLCCFGRKVIGRGEGGLSVILEDVRILYCTESRLWAHRQCIP